jgi:hypothetical protein
MKKGKLNPDHYKVPGGAPVDEGGETGLIRHQKARANRRAAGAKTGEARKTRELTRRETQRTSQQRSQKTGKRSSAQKTQSTRYGTEACLLLNQSTVPLGDNQPNGIERKSLEVKGPHLYLATCLLIWKTHGKVRHELVNLSAIEGKQDGS